MAGSPLPYSEYWFSPVITVGRHLTETVRAHRTGDPGAASPGTASTRRSQRRTHSNCPAARPSGALAIATVHEPAVLIADEVTTALDPITQRTVLDLLRAQAGERAIVLITHDLAAAARWADDIAVIHHGRIVEHGPVTDVLARPTAELTRELTDASALATTYAGPGERSGTALSGKGLTRALRGRGRSTIAVDGVDLEIAPGESIAIVGRSGSGKSTLIGALATLDRPDSGTVHHDVWALAERGRRTLRRRTGLIFQHPAAFDPRHSVRQVIAEAGPYDDDLLRRVGLDPAIARRHPATLSGGERQRVAIARALAQPPPASARRRTHQRPRRPHP
ncbi:ATP-binding cassette domain-containing protein [Actinoallomurus sp. NPDC052274]|uniref:ATP-binding cassette domain-containing protein n=1 Tax=Actinoallomurus sp. NPDC052274 TaxID=3155420 RepID=UPI00344361F2